MELTLAKSTVETPLNSLKRTVNEVKNIVCEQYLREYAPTLMSDCGMSENPFSGVCIYLNFLLAKKLNDLGYKAKLAGGHAVFGINNNQFGVVKYGEPSNMATLLPNGDLYVGNGFAGHCWIEIQDLNVIVDLSLMHLKDIISEDNKNRGIVDDEYLLDTNKLVISHNELISSKLIDAGNVGYYYEYSREATLSAMNNIKMLLTLIN